MLEHNPFRRTCLVPAHCDSFTINFFGGGEDGRGLEKQVQSTKSFLRN